MRPLVLVDDGTKGVVPFCSGFAADELAASFDLLNVDVMFFSKFLYFWCHLSPGVETNTPAQSR